METPYVDQHYNMMFRVIAVEANCWKWFPTHCMACFAAEIVSQRRLQNKCNMSGTCMHVINVGKYMRDPG